MALKYLALLFALTGCTVNHTQYQALEATVSVAYMVGVHRIAEEQRDFLQRQEEVRSLARKLK